jgi:hypothetical protein
VAEAAKEVAGEELLGGAELTAGSMGWGNNQRRLPPVRCSRRKTTAGESHCPALLAGATGRLLVQERRSDEALLLVRSDRSEAAHLRLVTAGKAVAGAEQSRAARR